MTSSFFFSEDGAVVPANFADRRTPGEETPVDRDKRLAVEAQQKQAMKELSDKLDHQRAAEDDAANRSRTRPSEIFGGVLGALVGAAVGFGVFPSRRLAIALSTATGAVAGIIVGHYNAPSPPSEKQQDESNTP